MFYEALNWIYGFGQELTIPYAVIKTLTYHKKTKMKELNKYLLVSSRMWVVHQYLLKCSSPVTSCIIVLYLSERKKIKLMCHMLNVLFIFFKCNYFGYSALHSMVTHNHHYQQSKTTVILQRQNYQINSIKVNLYIIPMNYSFENVSSCLYTSNFALRIMNSSPRGSKWLIFKLHIIRTNKRDTSEFLLWKLEH